MNKKIILTSIISLIIGGTIGYQINKDHYENPNNWEKNFTEKTTGVGYNNGPTYFNKKGIPSYIKITKDNGTEYSQSFYPDGRLSSIWSKTTENIVKRINFYENCLFCIKDEWETDKTGKKIKETYYDKKGNILK